MYDVDILDPHRFTGLVFSLLLITPQYNIEASNCLHHNPGYLHGF
jgi:hypothetical protein